MVLKNCKNDGSIKKAMDPDTIQLRLVWDSMVTHSLEVKLYIDGM